MKYEFWSTLLYSVLLCKIESKDYTSYTSAIKDKSTQPNVKYLS